MISQSIKRSAVAVAAMAITTVGFADVKWYDAVTVGGHVQGSYWGNFSEPASRTNRLQNYNNSSNSFSLNQALLKIAKPVGEGDDNYGFTVKLLYGQDAGKIHSTGLGSDASFDLMEAYGVYALKSVKGLTVTGGKFVTNYGVEVIESPLNPNISNGLLFFYGMPFAHVGAKANYTINSAINVTAGLVNGWDVATDNNPGKTAIWQIATTPAKGFVANLQGSYGPELLSDNVSKRTGLDLVLGYTGIDKLSIFTEALWGQDTNTAGVTDSNTNVWSGVGVWVSYAASDCLNPAIRFEVFDDRDGARLGGPSTSGPSALVGGDQTVKGLTITNKFIVNKNMFVRAEYRHDWSNVGTYENKDGVGRRTQNTGGLDLVVQF